MLKLRKTKYEEYALTIRDRHGKEVQGPEPDRETILEFIKRCGYSMRDLEGGTPLPHETNAKRYASTELFQRMIRDNDVHRVSEIGFNAGVSAYIFLLELRQKWGNENEYWFVVSFDYGIHPYTFYAKLYIDKLFPGRHILIDGDSKQSVVSVFNILKPKNPYMDLLFIDGDHTFDGAYLDLVNMRLYANSDTIVILDNMAPHRGVGQGPYLAVKKLFEEGKILVDEWLELKNYHDSMVVCRYKFEDSKPGKVKMDWVEAERYVAIWDATREYESNKTQENFIKFMNRVREIVKKREGVLDDYTKEMINREYRRYRRYKMRK